MFRELGCLAERGVGFDILLVNVDGPEHLARAPALVIKVTFLEGNNGCLLA